jgi:hypothetical protein
MRMDGVGPMIFPAPCLDSAAATAGRRRSNGGGPSSHGAAVPEALGSEVLGVARLAVELALALRKGAVQNLLARDAGEAALVVLVVVRALASLRKVNRLLASQASISTPEPSRRGFLQALVPRA